MVSVPLYIRHIILNRGELSLLFCQDGQCPLYIRHIILNRVKFSLLFCQDGQWPLYIRHIILNRVKFSSSFSAKMVSVPYIHPTHNT